MNNFLILLESRFRRSTKEETHLIPEMIMIDSSKHYTIPRDLNRHITFIGTSPVDREMGFKLGVSELDVYKIDKQHVNEQDIIRLMDDLTKHHVFYQHTTKANYERNQRDKKNRERLGLN